MRLVITAIVVMFIIGMAAWLVLYRNYSQMLSDVRQSGFRTPLIKLIIKKYIDCRKLDICVRNAEAFVEKNIENNRICGVLSYEALEKLARTIEYLIGMLAVVSAFFVRNTPEELYMCFTIGAVAVMALHLFGRLADIPKLHKMLVTELVDYIENSGALPQLNLEGTPKVSRLKGKAYTDFVKMNKSYEKIQASGKKLKVTDKCG